MAGSPHVVALRGDDPELVRQVGHLTDLVGLTLRVVPPGAPPPKAVLLLDGATGSEPWQQQPGGPPVVHVGSRHHYSAGRYLPGSAPDGGGAEPLAGPDPARVRLPEGAAELLERVADRPVRARTVAVMGAHGGAGASVLAAAIARVAAETGLATALVDLDATSGGLDLLLAIEHDPGLRWVDLQSEAGPFLPRLTETLPTWSGVRVLSGDQHSGTGTDHPVTTRALHALGQAHDLLVLDLPRGILVPEGAPPAVLGGCEAVLLVSGTTARAAAGAVSAAAVLRAYGAPARLVVRRGGPGALGAAELAARCQIPLGGTLREERSLGSGLERGLAPGDQRRGPLVAGARRLVRELGLTR